LFLRFFFFHFLDSALSCERLVQLGVPPCIGFADGIEEVLLPFIRK
jgi:hypothetical protein